ncbi:MAG TPA: class I SAM-dependent methyltransferase [Nitrososphaeraceae archaeon]|nr:class I SAM-dependent methyltransferase [Nitrososphaeraceae archaeon]
MGNDNKAYDISTTANASSDQVADFAANLTDIINGGTLSLMISIGHKTHLFDTMSKSYEQKRFATSVEIAKAANLNERYVREWLGAMVTGQIVNYDKSTDSYSLPPEHAALLTRSAGIDNFAMFFQYISLMGIVEDKIVECFYKGGGVPYSEYPRFQELQAEETSRIFDARLVDQILPLSSGLRDRLVRGIDVLDVGCGRGHAINVMAKAFPGSRFVGYDISDEGIRAANEEANKMGLSNVRFAIKDLSLMNDSEQYDLITAFDTIHDQAQPTKVLKKIYDALRMGSSDETTGIFLMQDIAASSYVNENISYPLAPTLYTISTMHCMTVSLASNGEGLGAVWGRQKAEQKLREAGFSGEIDVREIEGDILNYYYITRKTM